VDFDGPLLMVGAGTGLAPLYGVLQDRVERGLRVRPQAPAALFAGFRSEDEFLRGEDLKAWRADGYLTRLAVAFSRQGPAKAYVQDALDGDGALVVDILQRPDARFVVCGDAKMAQDVEDRLLQVLQREGSMSYPAALALVSAMKREERFVEDVWGVQLNRDVALPEVVRARYERGANWLARLQHALLGRKAPSGSILRI
jgi:sulfite reductase alpha subunit-like flavoprotein